MFESTACSSSSSSLNYSIYSNNSNYSTTRLLDVLRSSYHQYADDTQLYTTVKSPADQTQLTSCVEEVTRWFLVNGLLLNASKTEAIAFGTRQQLSKRTDADGRIEIGGTEIVVSDHIKILSVHLDSTLR